MKLELKHLAPYLPYGLKYKLFKKINGDHTLTTQSLLDWDFNLHDIIPILRPLSDLRNHNNEVMPVYRLEIPRADFTDILDEGKPVSQLAYCIIEKLFENHFDVFGLIDAGLAIDINKLRKNEKV